MQSVVHEVSAAEAQDPRPSRHERLRRFMRSPESSAVKLVKAAEL